MRPIPHARFEFGQKVNVHWQETELGTTEAVITGITYNPRRPHVGIEYTVMEKDGSQTDGIEDGMLSPR